MARCGTAPGKLEVLPRTRRLGRSWSLQPGGSEFSAAVAGNTTLERISGGAQPAEPRLIPRLGGVVQDRNPKWALWRVETVHPCNPHATDWRTKVRRDVEAQRPEKWRSFRLPNELLEAGGTGAGARAGASRPGSRQAASRPASRQGTPGITSRPGIQESSGSSVGGVPAAGRVVPDNEFRPSYAYHFPKAYEEQTSNQGREGRRPPPRSSGNLFKLDEDGFSSFPYSLAAHRAFLRTPMTPDNTENMGRLNPSTKDLCKGAGGRAPIVLSSDST